MSNDFICPNGHGIVGEYPMKVKRLAQHPLTVASPSQGRVSQVPGLLFPND